ncbi:ASPIC and UnbV [Planctomycetes bacterium K23_9]|uniref:ASPIC and UnbV n=2 Tax=Stieleria marina TaxID=1930275 RepID=A0A517NW18_9BACT|nr:ASPIC and UnbV [Planctomycetes bacterium K23_9]
MARTHLSCLILVATLTCVAIGCRDSGISAVKEPADPRSEDTTPVAETPRIAMRRAMDAQDWKRADQFVKAALITTPSDPDLLTDAAKIAAMSDRKREAAGLMVQAAQQAGFLPSTRVDHAVQALIDVGQLYDAIDLIEASLAVHPDNTAHRKMLIGFLGEAQRTELIPPHLKTLIQQRGFDLQLLLAFTENSSRRFSKKTADFLMQRNPDDHRVRLGNAQEQYDRRDATACAETLREILKHHPDFAPAHALLGQAIVLQDQLHDIPAWLATATANAAPMVYQYPHYWLTLGDWSAANEDYRQAARAYWEAGRRDPNDSIAWTRLAKALRSLQKRSASKKADDSSQSVAPQSVSPASLGAIDQRITRLLRLRELYDHFSWEGRDSQSIAVDVAEILFDLGRTWEAEAWTAVATTMTKSPSTKLAPLRTAIVAQLGQDPEWISTINQPALRLDLSDWPEPTVLANSPRLPARPKIIPTITTHDHLRLVDETQRWNLAGLGAKSIPGDATLAPLIRTLGVGGGTIDYDLDGWPDAVIMGAGGTLMQSDSAPNELMRNLGQQFANVTTPAGVVDRGFGQGVAVGDFNEDGFPDLFFANLGKNRLLRNNGDGSFTDCADLLHDNDWKQWSTCAAFFDLNRDGIADLLTTNYCETAANMDEACPDPSGKPGPCHPLKFAAHGDQFFVGAGDGRLDDVSVQWITDVLPGRGLGIVAGALAASEDATSSMGVFIANDMSANHYYQHLERDQRAPLPNVNADASSGILPESGVLQESATARGLAVDGRTLSQASMGIASSDFDGDGDLDFYVTGFGLEYNILYDQVSPGVWQDITGKLDLVQPTLPMVGFGTEAIDFDLDGIDELIVTNGHIGDFKKPDMPYEQPLQIFRRGKAGKFQWVDDASWGDYFDSNHVGRALWTIDANRDGRPDSMITHTYEQARLLINRTDSPHHRIAFRLVGTSDSRDAAGAIIRFQCDGRARTLWAIASGGYLCTNESILRAGTGPAKEITDVSVIWPSGETQSFGNLAADQEYLIVQGDAQPFATPFAADHPAADKPDGNEN